VLSREKSVFTFKAVRPLPDKEPGFCLFFCRLVSLMFGIAEHQKIIFFVFQSEN